MKKDVEVKGSEAASADAVQAGTNEFSFLDLLIVLVKHKALIVGSTAAAAALAAVLSFVLPNIYTGRAKILVSQQRNPAELYISMLKSRTVASRLAARVNIDSSAESLEQLERRTFIRAGRDGVITIEVDDKVPERAADLANGYVDELARLTRGIVLTEASKRRVVLENELKQTKSQLVDAEIALKQTQESGGLAKLDDEHKAHLEALAVLRADITAKGVQLRVLRTFASERDLSILPQVQNELAWLEGQLARLQATNKTSQGDSVRIGRTDEAGTEYIKQLRDVSYLRVLFELLAKQFEIAKIDEAADAPLVQFIDKAISPARHSKPNRSLIVAVTTLVAAIVAVLCAFIREAGQRLRNDPKSLERLGLLRRYLRSI